MKTLTFVDHNATANANTDAAADWIALHERCSGELKLFENVICWSFYPEC